MATKKKPEGEEVEPLKIKLKLVLQQSGEVCFFVDDPKILEELEVGKHYEADFVLTDWTAPADGGDKPPH